MSEKTKNKLAIASFICSIVFGLAAFCCPPIAIIDSSVLYYTAQLFLFSATLLGVNNLNLGKFGSNKKENKTD